MAEHDEVALYIEGAHAAVVGSANAVDQILRQLAPAGDAPLEAAQGLVDMLAAATGIASAVANHSGRWVQLTGQSQQWLQQFQAVPGADGSLLGVVRGSHGQFAHALSFTTTHVDPTMLADLH